MKGYPITTVIQEKSGRVKIKIGERDWISRGRYNFEQGNKIKLSSEQRVYHKNGDKANDDPDNLVAITFNATEYNLTHSRVLWIPKPSKKVAVAA